MKRVVTVIYAIISFLVFVGVFTWTGYGLHEAYTKNIKNANTSIDNMTEAYITLEKSQTPEVAGKNKEIYLNYFKQYPHTLIMTVYSPTRGIRYAVSNPPPEGRTYLESFIGESPEGGNPSWLDNPAPRYKGLPLILPKKLSRELKNLDGKETYILEAYFQTLPRNEIYNAIKFSFLILIFWFIVSLVFRLITSPGEEEPAEYTEEDPLGRNRNLHGEEEEYTYSDDFDEDLSSSSMVRDLEQELREEQEQEEYINTVLGEEDPSFSTDVDWEKPETDSIMDNGIINPEKTFDQMIPEEEPLEEDLPHPTSIPEEEDLEEPSQSTNLFSPHTGLGWEIHLLPRLETEIKRTAASDQDMVLALISIDDYLAYTNLKTLYNAIGRALLDLFIYQDLTFEKGDHSFAIIFPDTDIPEGIKNLENLRHKVARSSFDGETATVSVGLTGRNGRLVNAAQLLKEAESALKRARNNGENQIIAFKADPEKYRKIVAQKVNG